jgi:PadR family transcriptional regulator, regulatory protein PadR
MAKAAPSLPYATRDLLILRTLVNGPLHGYAITVRVHQSSSKLLRVEEGSLYPALHRLEQAGALSAEWRTTENNRRAKVYSLTSTGNRQLAEEQRDWERVAEGIARVLRFA